MNSQRVQLGSLLLQGYYLTNPNPPAKGTAAPARPTGGRSKPTRGKPRKPGVNNVQRQPEVPQPLMSNKEPVEGLYSIATSYASSMSDVPSHIVVDLNPVGQG